MRNSGLKKDIVSGSAYIFVGKIVTALSGLASNAFLARLLEPEELGAYFITLSLVTFSALIAQLGLTYTIVRLVAESMGLGQSKRATTAIIKVLMIGSVCAVFVAGLYYAAIGEWLAQSVFRSSHMTRIIGLSALWMIILTLQNIIAEAFRGYNDILKATIFSGLIRSMLSAVFFAIIWLSWGVSDIKQVTLVSVVAGGTSVALAGFFLGNRVDGFEADASISSSKILSIAIPMWIMALSVFVINNADLWILGAFRSEDEVALYGAVKRLIAIFIMPLIIINGVVQPLIAQWHAQGRLKDLENILRKTAGLAGVPAILLFMLFIFFGDIGLRVIYGSFYQQAYPVLVILSLGNLVNIWSGSCAVVMIMTDQQRLAMLITTTCGLMAIIGAIGVVRTYGYIGVATITAATLALQNILMLAFAKYKTGLWTYMKIPYKNFISYAESIVKKDFNKLNV